MPHANTVTHAALPHGHPPHSARKKPPFAVGARIEARFGGGELWFTGIIASASCDGTVDVAYEDGDREEGVSCNLVRLLGTPQPGTPTPKGGEANYSAGEEDNDIDDESDDSSNDAGSLDMGISLHEVTVCCLLL